MKIEGLKDLHDQLEGLGAVLAAKVLAVAARKAFAPVLEDARNRVPVDTGLLRDGIRIQVQRPKSGDSVVRVGLRIAAVKGAKKLGRRTASPHWRWHFVELGTSKMSARPFLRPALDGNAGAVVNNLKAELAAGIRRALRRKARGSG